MTDTKSRRHVLRLAAAGAVVATAATALTAKEALAYQGNMDRAIERLQEARSFLRDATPDKGGHKARAIELIDQAIGQTREGIRYAAENFGD